MGNAATTHPRHWLAHSLRLRQAAQQVGAVDDGEGALEGGRVGQRASVTLQEGDAVGVHTRGDNRAAGLLDLALPNALVARGARRLQRKENAGAAAAAVLHVRHRGGKWAAATRQ